jgi:hypothetical protein
MHSKEKLHVKNATQKEDKLLFALVIFVLILLSFAFVLSHFIDHESVRDSEGHIKNPFQMIADSVGYYE